MKSSGIYRDSQLFIDPRVIICGYPLDGDGPHDGAYLLVLHIAVGRAMREICLQYPSLALRDQAFTQLAALRQDITESSVFDEEDDETYL